MAHRPIILCVVDVTDQSPPNSPVWHIALYSCVWSMLLTSRLQSARSGTSPYNPVCGRCYWPVASKQPGLAPRPIILCVIDVTDQSPQNSPVWHLALYSGVWSMLLTSRLQTARSGTSLYNPVCGRCYWPVASKQPGLAPRPIILCVVDVTGQSPPNSPVWHLAL